MIGDMPQQPDWTRGALGPHEVHLRRGVSFAEVVHHVRGDLVYLATPYSRRAVNERGRWDLAYSLDAQAAATFWAGRFAREGVTAISPIALSAEIVHFDRAQARPPEFDPLDATFWERWCRPMLTAADCVVVPPVAGWDESLGVWREVVASAAALRPVWIIAEGA